MSMFRSIKSIASLCIVLTVLASILSACSDPNAKLVPQETATEEYEAFSAAQNVASAEQDIASAEQDDASAEQDIASAEQDDASAGQDEASMQEDSYEDGLGEDGKIHVNPVGAGEKVSDFESSFIDYLIYYQESGHLIICMKGKKYAFANVDEALWEDFKNAESKGSFYNTEMRNNTKYHIKDYDGTNGDLIVVEHIDD